MRKKEQEKERKGAAIPWQSVVGAGSSGMKAGGAFGPARLAGALANFFGGPSTFLGGIFASNLGAKLVLGGLVSWTAVLGVAGYTAFKPAAGGGAPSGAAFPAIGGMDRSSLVIDTPKNRSLNMLANVNQGSLTFDEKSPLASSEEGSDAPKDDVSAPPSPAGAQGVEKSGKGGLNRDGFVGKMTQDVAQLNGGGVGSGGPRLADGTNGFNMKKIDIQSKLRSNAETKAFERYQSYQGPKKQGTSRAKSSRAMGQLKFAQKTSRMSSMYGSDKAKQGASDAFEQGRMKGGVLGVTDPSGLVMPAGGPGAPDVGDETIPDTGFGHNVTPYQSNVDSAKSLSNNAGKLKATGMMLIMLGLGMIATGMALMGNHTTFPIGVALVAAGTAMVAMGMMMLAMGAMQRDMAKGQAQKVGQADGQKEQQSTASSCADKAYQQGKSVREVCPDGVDPIDTSRGTGVREAVDAERNSGFSLSN